MTVLTAALGVCFFVFKSSITYLAIAISIIVILFAAFFAVLAIADKNRRFAFFIKIVLAVSTLTTGVATLIARDAVINVLVGIFGLVLIMDGSFKLHTAAMSKRYSLVGWWIVAVISILTVAGGYITVRYLKLDDAPTLHLLGSTFIVDAIGNLFSAFYISGYEKRQTNLIKKNCEKQKEEETPATREQ